MNRSSVISRPFFRFRPLVRSGRTVGTTGWFSKDYFEARSRFLEAVERCGFRHFAIPIDAVGPAGSPLSIDVAVGGSSTPRKVLILSSGLHGVEGFFGSAAQLAYLGTLSNEWWPAVDSAVVLIHALNPFGFAWRRRFNENNVDLNRNFLLPGEDFAGSPPLSGAFRDALLSRTESRLGRWNTRLAMLAWKHGMASFWETLPVGQYDFADWLFFGGQGYSQTAKIVEEGLPSLLGNAEEAIHLDFHTGLGRWAECQLLLSETEPLSAVAWWRRHFPASMVVQPPRRAGSYQVRGGFGPWLKAIFPACRYRFATAEFGTYSPARVLRALTEEQYWHNRQVGLEADHWSRRRLAETFAPRNLAWRQRAVGRALQVVAGASGVLGINGPAKLASETAFDEAANLGRPG